jgi:hypothetical protein
MFEVIDEIKDKVDGVDCIWLDDVEKIYILR